VGTCITFTVISEVVPFSLPNILELVSCEKAKLKDKNAMAQIIRFIFFNTSNFHDKIILNNFSAG
jgi:hypothetical protein